MYGGRDCVLSCSGRIDLCILQNESCWESENSSLLRNEQLQHPDFGSGVDCYDEKAHELYAFADQNQPIAGRDLLQITASIRQTIEGDFQAFDSEAIPPWIFIRAWDGSGFYIETNDAEIKRRLQTHFRAIEEVEGAMRAYSFTHSQSTK